MGYGLRYLFGRITPEMHAAKELAGLELGLLKAHQGREWADSAVSYNEAGIKRLRKFLAESAKARKEDTPTKLTEVA